MHTRILRNTQLALRARTQVQYVSALQKCYNVPLFVESILKIDIHVARGNRPVLDIVNSTSNNSTFNSSKLILRHRHRRRMHTSTRKLQETREHWTHVLNIVTHLMYLRCEKPEQRQSVAKTQSTVLEWWTKTFKTTKLDEEQRILMLRFFCFIPIKRLHARGIMCMGVSLASYWQTVVLFRNSRESADSILRTIGLGIDFGKR